MKTVKFFLNNTTEEKNINLNTLSMLDQTFEEQQLAVECIKENLSKSFVVEQDVQLYEVFLSEVTASFLSKVKVTSDKIVELLELVERTILDLLIHLANKYNVFLQAKTNFQLC